MDLLLRLANGRTLLALLAAGCGLILLLRVSPASLRWLHDRRYPPQKASNPLGDQILRELSEKDRLRVEALHRGLLDELAAAKAQGFDVADLETRAQTAASFNVTRTRAEAERLLNEVRRDIPIKESAEPPLPQYGKGQSAPGGAP
ncbi:MAG: hypothetical protein HY924_02605 [Elusimicrobia bacterium]|nr:hypothetical protein [Elusimicrobiota bacterium]